MPREMTRLELAMKIIRRKTELFFYLIFFSINRISFLFFVSPQFVSFIIMIITIIIIIIPKKIWQLWLSNFLFLFLSYYKETKINEKNVFLFLIC